MKQLVDVVNFNSDASCLSTRRWFDIISGGSDSELCNWLQLYPKYGKKVVLGLTGATIADMAVFNPEAIDIIRSYPDFFQLIIRPFMHDNSIVRTSAGFKINLKFGLLSLEKEFGKTTIPYYLPPEFMLTNQQLAILADMGICGTFINAERFSHEISSRIPTTPYFVKGVFGAQLGCVPFGSKHTKNYLESIHLFDSTAWNREVLSSDSDYIYSWRDGESPFLVPDPIAREDNWLRTEDISINRVHIDYENIVLSNNDELEDSLYHSYPLHSMLPWMRDFKTFAFINRSMLLEDRLTDDLKSPFALTWLLSISSDVFSAIEKPSPSISLKSNIDDGMASKFTILRSEKGFEGDEFFILAEECRRTGVLPENMLNADKWLHHRRYLARLNYLESI